jgi:periplasmic protein TonB
MCSRETILSLLVAAGGHAAVLFGLEVGSARPSGPLPEAYIEVSLSAAPGLPNDDSIFTATLPNDDSRAPHAEEETIEEIFEVSPTPADPESSVAEVAPEPEIIPEQEMEVPVIQEPEVVAEAEVALPALEIPPAIAPAAVTDPAPAAPPEPALTAVPAPAPTRATPALASLASTVPQAAFGPAGSAGEYHPTDVYFTRQVRPEYTEARKLGQEGLVIVRAFINSRGRTDHVEVTQTSGFPLLDEAARRAAEQSRYRPAYFEKKPVPARVEIPYRFVLTRKDSPAVTAKH